MQIPKRLRYSIHLLRGNAWAIFSCVLLIVSLVVLFTKFSENAWGNLLAGFISSSVVVILGFGSLEIYLKKQREKIEYADLRSFFGGDGIGNRPWWIIVGVQKSKDISISPIQFEMSYAKSQGLRALEMTIKRVLGDHTQVYPVLADQDYEINLSEIDGNICLLGGEVSLPCFGEISRYIGVPYYQYDNNDYKCIYSKCFNESIRSKLDISSPPYVDYGTVTRVIWNDSRLVILFNGNIAAGLFASILSVTNTSIFSNYSFTQSSVSQQALIEVEFNNNAVLPSQFTVSMRQWIQWDAPRSRTSFSNVGNGSRPPNSSIEGTFRTPH